MRKPRRHERIPRAADLVVQRGADQAERFAGWTVNVSRGGLAMFCQRALEPGEMLSFEMILPTAGEGIRRITLFGVVRWIRVEPDGNVMGVEFLTEQGAGDYGWFLDHFDSHVCPPGVRRTEASCRQGGFTLVELTIAMVIICLMVTLAAPIFTRSIEHSRMDAAVANLRGVWAAQRAYWLEERCFAPLLSSLLSKDLVDAAIVNSASDPEAVYVFDILSADSSHFVCRALRSGSVVWSGDVRINEEGTVSGAITSSRDGTVLAPTQ